MSLSNKLRRRLLPMLLSIVMVFQSLPATAWATPDQDSNDNNQQYQEVTEEQVQEELQEFEEPEFEEEAFPEEEISITEEKAYNIANIAIPSVAVVTDIALSTWTDDNWTELEWMDDDTQRYFRVPQVSGNFAVLLDNYDHDYQVNNEIAISSNKAVRATTPKDIKWQTMELYSIKKAELVTIREKDDLYVMISPDSSNDKVKLKIVKTDLFNSASVNAIIPDLTAADPVEYVVKDTSPYYYDLVLRLEVPEKGVYKINAVNKEKGYDIKTNILDIDGKYDTYTYSTNSISLDAGTYFLAYNYGDDNVTGVDTWGDPVTIQLTVAKITGFSAALKAGQKAEVYYGYTNGQYVNKDKPEEYYNYYNSAFTNKYTFTATYSDGSTAQISSFGNDFLAKNDFSEWNIIGETYTVIFSYAGMDITTDVRLRNYLDYRYADDYYPIIKEDVAETGVDYDTFSFTAKDAGVYYFYSFDIEGDMDPYGTLNYRTTSKGDDDSYDGKNFYIVHYLKAGERVLINCQNNNYEGSCSLMVSRIMPALGNVSLDKFDLTGKTINLVFVVDVTGSMGDEIEAVRDNLIQFVDRITATHANLRMSLISFQDITQDNYQDPTIVFKNEASLGSVWFENHEAEALKQVIGSLRARNGGDEAECDVDALANLVFDDIYTWNSAAAKFAFLITDAPYKNDNIHGIKDMEELTGLLAKKGIAVTTITAKRQFKTYSPLAQSTGGTLININDDFSRGMDRFAYDIVSAADTYYVDPSIVPVTGIDLGGDLTVPLGRTRNFTPVITPANASNKDVVWRVVDTDIARIVSTGATKLAIKGIKEGTTKVVAISKDGGYTASFEFSVAKSVISGNSVESCDSKDLITYLDDAALKEFRLVSDSTETTTVDLTDQKTIYSAIKGKDKSIGFEFMDLIGDLAYSWKFAGTGITDENKTISDYAIAVDPDSGASDIAVAEGFKAYLPIGFKHHGDLPGTADIKFVSDLIKNGTYTLYYFNEATKKLEDTGKTVTVADGVSEFDITHCSTYVLGSKNAELSNAMDITFESNGGSEVAAQKLLLGQKVVKPADPTKEGFTFGGWFKDAACTDKWDFDKDVVRGKTILYARWIIQVESVALDKTEAVELIAGDKLELNATVLPANATDKSLLWTSSDAAVATVTDGAVTAVAAGKATITVKSASNEKATSTMQVIVTAVPTDTIIVKGSVVLKPGAKVKSWEFEEGYKDVISAKKSSKSCTVKGKAKGTVSVKAVLKDGTEKTYVVRVENVALADRSFDKKDEILNAKELFTGSRLAEAVKFKSSNKKIISIDSKTGEMKVLKNGKVKISVTFGKTTIKKTYKVTMPEAGKKSVSLKAGKTAKVQIKNFNAALGEYTLSFDKQGVAGATIDPATGEIVITGIAKGTTNISIKLNGTEYSKIKVKVK